jgi:ABC-type transporter Mla subunit MlaD
MMPSGGVLPISQTDEYVDVDQVLSILHGQTRQRARQIFRSLGAALQGHGIALNSAVGQGAGAISGISALTNQVLDPERSNIASLTQAMGDVAAAIGDRSAAIDTIANEGLVALGALRDRDAALAATLHALPETLGRLHTLADTIGSASAHATPVLTDLAGAVAAARPAVAALPQATQQGSAVLQSLSGASPELEQTLHQATTASAPLARALPTVKTTLCQFNPMLGYIQGRAYQALSVLIGLGSASNSYDATGHLIRLFPILGDASLAGLPDSVIRADQTLLHGGILGASTALSYDPYPQPGALGVDQAINGGPIGPSEISGSGYRYPHVTAEC